MTEEKFNELLKDKEFSETFFLGSKLILALSLTFMSYGFTEELLAKFYKNLLSIAADVASDDN